MRDFQDLDFEQWQQDIDSCHDHDLIALCSFEKHLKRASFQEVAQLYSSIRLEIIKLYVSFVVQTKIQFYNFLSFQFWLAISKMT